VTRGPLTDRQREALEVIEESFRTRGCAPTVRELQEALALRSSSSAHHYLRALREAGYIEGAGWRGARTTSVSEELAARDAAREELVAEVEVALVVADDTRLTDVGAVREKVAVTLRRVLSYLRDDDR
jgi:SOS-response transcriptional repressor LexA